MFKVPAGEAEYKLTTSVKRSVKVPGRLHPGRRELDVPLEEAVSGLRAELPASTVRFNARRSGLDSRVEAGRTVTFPVTVEGAARGRNLKSLTVYVSYDDGRTWTKLTVGTERSLS